MKSLKKGSAVRFKKNYPIRYWHGRTGVVDHVVTTGSFIVVKPDENSVVGLITCEKSQVDIL